MRTETFVGGHPKECFGGGEKGSSLNVQVVELLWGRASESNKNVAALLTRFLRRPQICQRQTHLAKRIKIFLRSVAPGSIRTNVGKGLGDGFDAHVVNRPFILSVLLRYVVLRKYHSIPYIAVLGL